MTDNVRSFPAKPSLQQVREAQLRLEQMEILAGGAQGMLDNAHELMLQLEEIVATNERIRLMMLDAAGRGEDGREK